MRIKPNPTGFAILLGGLITGSGCAPDVQTTKEQEVIRQTIVETQSEVRGKLLADRFELQRLLSETTTELDRIQSEIDTKANFDDARNTTNQDERIALLKKRIESIRKNLQWIDDRMEEIESAAEGQPYNEPKIIDDEVPPYAEILKDLDIDTRYHPQ